MPSSNNAPVETKVKASSAATYLVGVAVLAVINAVQGETALISALPDWAEPFLLAVLPAAGAAVAGWYAPHTPRTNRTVPSGPTPPGEEG